jgi:putative ABC transport system ATP-binding protein
VSAETLAVFDQVTKHYLTPGGAVAALAAVDARIPAGKVTAVVGVSGSGKSTLLRLLAGLDAPSSGTVAVAGRDLAALSARELNRFRRREVRYVPQRAADNLYPQLTLKEHLLPGASLELFELLGMTKRIDAHPAELSGGELARASFAVALAHGTPLVVVDEPTAELDRATASDVLTAIRERVALGQTFVVATHDPDVVALADEVLDLTTRRPAAVRTTARTQPLGGVALRVQGANKSYAGAVVLADASLSVRAGELVLVVGRSGSGKSTLLMLTGGWIEPDSGTVEPSSTRWADLAYVPQRFGLVPELTVEENIELPARRAAAPPMPDLLERLAIEELRNRTPGEISIGQQQRVAIARALRLASPILLVDEPTSHQDAVHAELVWAALREAATTGSACLVATHELDAHNRADHWWQIDNGRLQAASDDPS